MRTRPMLGLNLVMGAVADWLPLATGTVARWKRCSNLTLGSVPLAPGGRRVAGRGREAHQGAGRLSLSSINVLQAYRSEPCLQVGAVLLGMAVEPTIKDMDGRPWV